MAARNPARPTPRAAIDAAGGDASAYDQVTRAMVGGLSDRVGSIDMKLNGVLAGTAVLVIGEVVKGFIR